MASEGTDSRERIERLEAAAAELEALEEERPIYERTVRAAVDLFDAEACGIYTVEDGRLVPEAATDTVLHVDVSYREADAGIAGRTLDSGESLIVDDLRDADADPSRDAHRSALSLPLHDGVLQVLSTEVSAFDETDRELGELLVDHVEHALERVRYEAAVERERDRFVALFQNVPDAAVQYTFDDGEPRIERVNSAFVRLFGYDPETADGESTLDLLVPADRRERTESLYEAVQEGDRIEEEVVRETTEGRRQFLLRSVPVPTDDEAPQGYLIYTDIAEMKRRQRELERKNDRLDAFASTVSHDLRNPLTIALGYARTGNSREDPAFYGEVVEELERMNEMIEELLTLARSGELVGDAELLELTDVVDEAWSHVDTADADLREDVDATVEADRTRLAELFENLFRNATEHAGPDVTVTVGTIDDGSGEGARGIYVADDGPGIPDEHKSEVLDRGFSTADDGTGFGLALVAEIARAHGWVVDVTDAADGGARFEFLFSDGGTGEGSGATDSAKERAR